MADMQTSCIACENRHIMFMGGNGRKTLRRECTSATLVRSGYISEMRGQEFCKCYRMGCVTPQ